MSRSRRTVAHFAVRAGVDPTEALATLSVAGVRVGSTTHVIRKNEVRAAEIALGLARARPTSSPDSGIADGADTRKVEGRPRQQPRAEISARARHGHVGLPERPTTPPDQSGIHYLSVEDVLAIHFALVEMFAKEGDPIVPAGPRGDNLLASALMRPRTSLGRHEKYQTLPDKAAALFHSLVTNHPFHNGNKRTALVATLSFLDHNGRRVKSDIEDDELFDFVLAVSAGTFSASRNADEIVEGIASWWRNHTVGQDHAARDMYLPDFLQACEAAGARVVERGGGTLVQGINGRSVRIGGATRKLKGNVIKAWVSQLGLAGSTTGTRLDEFQDQLSPELLVTRFMSVLRRLAYL
jgi:death-on-curing family protein